MKRLTATPCILFAFLPAPAAQANPTELVELRASYVAAHEEEVVIPSEEKKAALYGRIHGAFTRELNRAQKAGELNRVLALTSDIELLKKNSAPPSSDQASLHPATRRLRDAWRKNYARLQKESDRLSVVLRASYIKKLNTLQTRLTQAGRIKDAVAVQDAISELQNDTLLTESQPAAVTPEAPAPSPTGPAPGDLLRWHSANGDETFWEHGRMMGRDGQRVMRAVDRSKDRDPPHFGLVSKGDWAKPLFTIGPDTVLEANLRIQQGGWVQVFMSCRIPNSQGMSNADRIVEGFSPGEWKTIQVPLNNMKRLGNADIPMEGRRPVSILFDTQKRNLGLELQWLRVYNPE